MLLSSVFVGLGLFVPSLWAYPAPLHDQELGAVASESSVCSNIGIDILKEGGNAADAVNSISIPILTTCTNTNTAHCTAILRRRDWNVSLRRRRRRIHACSL